MFASTGMVTEKTEDFSQLAMFYGKCTIFSLLTFYTEICDMNLWKVLLLLLLFFPLAFFKVLSLLFVLRTVVL